MQRILAILRRSALLVLIVAGVSAGVQAQAPEVAGAWDLVFNTEQGEMAATLTLKVDGAAVTGSLSSPQGESTISGTLEGAQLKMSMDMNGMQIALNAEIAGIAMKGNADYGMGTAPFYGKRK